MVDIRPGDRFSEKHPLESIAMNILGIDLGTTNSVVCEYKNGTKTIVKIEGRDTIPSVIHIDGGTIEVGQKAKRKILIKPEKTISSMKRCMGTRDVVNISGRDYDAVDAAGMLLSYIKEQTEKEIGGTVRDVVVTVPAYFDEQQKKETRTAAENAGLNVLRLLPEPTAAAIAYGLDKEKNQTLMVFDLGGGTFDISILEVNNNEFTVKAVGGDSKLGGDDFDNALVEYIFDWIDENFARDLRGDATVRLKIKEEAERAKIELTDSRSTDILVPGVGSGMDVEIPNFTRKQFRKIVEPLLDRIVGEIDVVFNESGLSLDDINRIVLVGGGSKNPIVQDLLKEHYREGFRADDMDTFVARGAAIVCAGLSVPAEFVEKDDNLPTDLIFKDVISHSLGVGMVTSDGDPIFIPILKKNEQYPARAATLGFRIHQEQEELEMKVYRGEDALPENNTRLGKLSLWISPEYKGVDMSLAVGCIFELDDNGILRFTAVEMPVTPEMSGEIKTLVDEGLETGIVSAESIDRFLLKYNLREEKVSIGHGVL